MSGDVMENLLKEGLLESYTTYGVGEEAERPTDLSWEITKEKEVCKVTLTTSFLIKVLREGG